MNDITVATDYAKKWRDKIDEALKREKDWRKQSKDIVEVYEMEQEPEFNILFSNVETMRPSLFFQEPKPFVKRRYSDKDPVGKAVSEVIERALSYSLDSYDFYQEGSDCVLDLLLPGRAVMRTKYNPELQGEGDEEVKTWEEVACDYWPWDRFTHGEGRRWKQVPWIAYEHYLDKKEFESRFPEKEFNPDVKSDKSTDKEPKKVSVWEIWNKATRTIIFLAFSHEDGILEEIDDPLGLEGFFDTPQPLYSACSTANLIPIPDYGAYEKQAKELNEVSKRIQKITKGLKLRGIYDSTMEEMSTLMQADDNELVPATNAMVAIGQSGGLEKAVWLWPVETAARVLAQLYIQRDQIKQVIYEITGLSDILRGASDPNETLGAQELKAQTGSLRIQRRQREIQRYFRDVLRLNAEIICEHFEPETLQQMTGKEVNDEMLKVMRSDMLRGYRIDIETDSTVLANQHKEQENMAKALSAVGEYAKTVAPLVQQGIIPEDGAKELLLAGIRRFQFGREVEEYFTEDEQEQPEIDPQIVEQEVQRRMGEEMQKVQQSAEFQQQQAEQQKAASEMQQGQAEMQQKQRALEQERQLADAEHALKMKELEYKQIEQQAAHSSAIKKAVTDMSEDGL